MKGERRPILRFVPCKDGGFNLGDSQLAPYELCAACPNFEGETQDGLAILCSKNAKFSLTSIARGVKNKLQGVFKTVRPHHA